MRMSVIQRCSYLRRNFQTKNMAANTSASVDNNVPIQRDKFVCIEYPGRVENVDKMLDTLGNEEAVSKTFSNPNHRIELRFRPDNPFCKPVCGNLYPTNNLLIRVKRRYRRPKKTRPETDASEERMQGVAGSSSGATIGGEEEDVVGDVEYKSEILGVVESSYRFKGMCDFQVLPVHKTQEGKMESLIEKIVPSNIVDETAYLAQNIPYHLQPPSFSRTDLPIGYNYKPDAIQHRPNYPPIVELESNLIGRNRARRPHNTHIMTYQQGAVPKEPQAGALKRVELYKNMDDVLEELKKLFDKRPLWSKNALKCNIELSDHNFKVLLPLIAYYYSTGPWRALWCRLGYDPRKNPEGKQYQMLDFRLRKVMSKEYGKGVIKAKRSTYMYRLPITIRKPKPGAVTVGQKNEEIPESIPKEAYYIFRRGLVPAYQQMFYQLCDLHDDALQAIIHSNDGKETSCDERNGWLEPDVLGKLRDELTDILKQTFINLGKQLQVGDENAQSSEDQPSTSQTPSQQGDEEDDNGQDIDDDIDDDGDDDDDTLDQGDGDDDDDGNDDEDDDINEMEMEMLEYMDTGDT